MSRKDLCALGSKRESLNTNPLLIRAETGKIRRRCFTLPPTDFTYGINTECKDGGTAEAISRWNFHKPSRTVNRKEPERDFIALNKTALRMGLTSAQDHTQFRATHDIRRKEVSRKTLHSAPTFHPDMVFGISTRPSTPIYDLLENRYQEEWLQQMREEEERNKKETTEKNYRLGKVYETRASLMRRYSEPVDPGPLWKMKRFSKIPAHLQTFRSEKARAVSFHHHASDATSRTGMFGHGIYQAAKC